MAAQPSTKRRTRLDLSTGAIRSNPHLTAPEERSLDILALLADPKPMHSLLLHLRRQGLLVDTVADLHAARTAFFGAGGHDCLVIAPDVRPGVATSVAGSLGAIDPQLAMATFGPQLSDRATRTARLGSFHPGSRAGQGALLRFLRTL